MSHSIWPFSHAASRQKDKATAALGIPTLDIFLPELDDKSNPLKSKGIGELGICGAGASLANAIYNACGARVRDYPITLDKLLSELPAQE